MAWLFEVKALALEGVSSMLLVTFQLPDTPLLESASLTALLWDIIEGLEGWKACVYVVGWWSTACYKHQGVD